MLGIWTRYALAVVFFVFSGAQAQRVMEKINRGLIAVKVAQGQYLSWRLLGTEPQDIGFNVYKGSTLLNSTPITGATLYTDATAGTGTYTVKPVINGQEGETSEPARVLSGDYFNLPIEPPSNSYTANDLSVGDLDGDGEYEIILKWDPTNSKDNSQAGKTDVVYLDAYRLDGKRLWRMNLGVNIRAGAHYTQFMVYDLDGDGKAEMVLRTADGSRDALGTVIGDGNVDHRNSDGYILKGPEFLTVFEGLTGKALYTTKYLPERGDPCGWGDPNCTTYANRVDRFLAGVAYLDGIHPSVVMCRGYYTRTVLVAWDWKDGKLTQRWIFDTNQSGYASYTDQGNHQLSVADVDQDGKDEIIYGAMAIDDNGKGLWNTGFGHGDALHVGDFDPSRPGLEVFDIHEGGAQPGCDFRDAKTGKVYWKTANEDVGRGVAADILASNPGAEFWGASGGTRNANGGTVDIKPNSTNFLAWWDGDLLRELVNDNTVTKAGGGVLLTAAGCVSNNGTKSTPGLTADLFGDWREEVIWRTSDNKALRIYTTTLPTTYRIYTLMHNPAYRLAVAWQNVAYNQPPHVDYFLGDGMTLPVPKPNITTPQGLSVAIKPSTQTTPAFGNMIRYAHGRELALPLGFARRDQLILLRDAFGRIRAKGRPEGGSLRLPAGLPEGLYYLQQQAVNP